MRIRLSLRISNTDRTRIPDNYQYPLSAWVYHTIAESNHEFATFLHNAGYINEHQAYKLLIFSKLRFPGEGFRVSGVRLQILSEQCSLILSLLVPVAIGHFVTGIFRNQTLLSGDQISRAPLTASMAESDPGPVFNGTAGFRYSLPVLTSGKNIGNLTDGHLSPDHVDYERILTGNLIRKFSAAINSGLPESGWNVSVSDPDIRLEIKNTPGKWGIAIKVRTPSQTSVNGCTCDFRLTAPQELIQTGYQSGFSEMNSIGMGCTELISD